MSDDKGLDVNLKRCLIRARDRVLRIMHDIYDRQYKKERSISKKMRPTTMLMATEIALFACCQFDFAWHTRDTNDTGCSRHRRSILRDHCVKLDDIELISARVALASLVLASILLQDYSVCIEAMCRRYIVGSDNNDKDESAAEAKTVSTLVFVIFFDYLGGTLHTIDSFVSAFVHCAQLRCTSFAQSDGGIAVLFKSAPFYRLAKAVIANNAVYTRYKKQVLAQACLLLTFGVQHCANKKVLMAAIDILLISRIQMTPELAQDLATCGQQFFKQNYQQSFVARLIGDATKSKNDNDEPTWKQKRVGWMAKRRILPRSSKLQIDSGLVPTRSLVSNSICFRDMTYFLENECTRLSSGTFGVVYSARRSLLPSKESSQETNFGTLWQSLVAPFSAWSSPDCGNSNSMAIKHFTRCNCEDVFASYDVLQEINTILSLRGCAGLLQCTGVLHTFDPSSQSVQKMSEKPCTLLQTPLYQCNMQDFIANRRKDKQTPVFDSQMQYFGAVLSLVRGLATLHKKLLTTHGDIKTPNILVSLNRHGQFRRAVLADFGTCSYLAPLSFDESIVDECTTICWRAPERLWCQSHKGKFKNSFACDIWSLAVCMFEMCTGQNPFAYIHKECAETELMAMQYKYCGAFLSGEQTKRLTAKYPHFAVLANNQNITKIQQSVTAEKTKTFSGKLKQIFMRNLRKMHNNQKMCTVPQKFTSLFFDHCLTLDPQSRVSAWDLTQHLVQISRMCE